MIAFALLASLAGAARALDLKCPETLAVEQKAAAPKDWRLGKSQFKPMWSGVGLFDGPPEERADLVPDNEGDKKPFSVWTLDPKSARVYWLECRYASTTLTLARALPKGLKSCRVDYAEDESVEGHPRPLSVSCK